MLQKTPYLHCASVGRGLRQCKTHLVKALMPLRVWGGPYAGSCLYLTLHVLDIDDGLEWCYQSGNTRGCSCQIMCHAEQAAPVIRRTRARRT
jgi:hypothetical protein